MTSSTSSSEYLLRKIPVTDGRTFLISFFLALAFLAGISELAFHMRKFPPLFDTSDSAWFQNLKSVRDFPETTDIVFYGSSRTQLGISPKALVEKMKEEGQNARCWNLGLAASEDAGLIAHIRENIQADVVVVEQFGTQFSTPVRPDDINRYQRIRAKTRRYHLEQNIRRMLAANFRIFRDKAALSLFWNRYYKLFSHDDGWLETVYNRDPKVLEKQKHHYETLRSVERIPETEARQNQMVYDGYFREIIRRGARLVIIRMPVAGKRAAEWDQVLSDPWHSDFILRNPSILYIDANRHPKLRRYIPVEDSHLDAADALEFSKDVGEIINNFLMSERSGNHLSGSVPVKKRVEEL